MDDLNEPGELDEILEQDLKFHSKPKTTNGARRKAQRLKKREREASVEKPQAQEELARPKKKSKHGRRSPPSNLKAIGRRLRKWVDEESISTDKILYVEDDVLEQFEDHNTNCKIVAKSIQDLSNDPELLEVAPKDGVFVIRRESKMPQPARPPSPSDMDVDSNPGQVVDAGPSFPSSNRTSEVPQSLKWEPRFAAIRLTNIMSEEAEAAIIGAVQRMTAHGVTVPPGTVRSKSTGAHHVGIWSKFWLTVYATANTLTQNMGAQSEMDSLFQLISKHVNHPIMGFLEQVDPDYAQTLRRINQYVQMALDDRFIHPPLKHLRSLGPLFNVFAMKYGGSEIPHLDLGDVPGLYAIIVVLDDFEGGDFCLPHLGYRIPLPRRSVLLVDARRLVHSTGLFTGDRFVITGFIDYNTAVHAGIKTTEFSDLNQKEFGLWLEQRVLGEQAKVDKKSRKMGRSKSKPSTSKTGTEHQGPAVDGDFASTQSMPLPSGVSAEAHVPADARSRPLLRRSTRPPQPVFSGPQWNEIIDALK